LIDNGRILHWLQQEDGQTIVETWVMNYNETSLREIFLYEDCAYLQGKINGHGCFPNSTKGTNKGILAKSIIIAYCKEAIEKSEVSIAENDHNDL
jgi:hypothetical protein